MSEPCTDHFGFVSDDVKEYVALRIKAFKLASVEHLSSFTSSAFGILIFVLCITISLLLLTIGLTLWIGFLLGNTALAFAIMGGFFGVISILAYALRNKLINNALVKCFSKMFFTDRKSDDNATRQI